MRSRARARRTCAGGVRRALRRGARARRGRDALRSRGRCVKVLDTRREWWRARVMRGAMAMRGAGAEPPRGALGRRAPPCGRRSIARELRSAKRDRRPEQKRVCSMRTSNAGPRRSVVILATRWRGQVPAAHSRGALRVRGVVRAQTCAQNRTPSNLGVFYYKPGGSVGLQYFYDSYS